ncbi:MAG: hypothetical protein PHC92_09820 [Syntrophomonadaceae bacterium]|nr:hypothetical protein [Syntrophomonadaceae bacterium]
MGVNSILVSDAKKIGVIPEDWHDIVKDLCICKQPLHISENRKKLWCPNIRCQIKVAKRMESMLRGLGVKGMGYAYCMAFVRQNNLIYHIAILGAGLEKHPKSVSEDIRLRNMYVIREELKKPRTYKEAVQLLDLPGLDATALKVFRGIKNYSDFISKVKMIEGKFPLISFIAKQTGIYGKSTLSIAKTLKDFEKDLYFIDKVFNLENDSTYTWNVAITGNIVDECKLSRNEFPAYVKNISNGLISIRISKAYQSVKYIIADYPSNSETYRVGYERNKRAGGGILLNSKEFCDKVREATSNNE